MRSDVEPATSVASSPRTGSWQMLPENKTSLSCGPEKSEIPFWITTFECSNWLNLMEARTNFQMTNEGVTHKSNLWDVS